MAANAVRMTLPAELSPGVLAELLDDVRSREQLLRSQIAQFEISYAESLTELEARLDRGEGQEHPDWEDAIAWRNSVEALNRQDQLRSLLEWILGSVAPLHNS